MGHSLSLESSPSFSGLSFPVVEPSVLLHGASFFSAISLLTASIGQVVLPNNWGLEEEKGLDGVGAGKGAAVRAAGVGTSAFLLLELLLPISHSEFQNTVEIRKCSIQNLNKLTVCPHLLSGKAQELSLYQEKWVNAPYFVNYIFVTS